MAMPCPYKVPIRLPGGAVRVVTYVSHGAWYCQMEDEGGQIVGGTEYGARTAREAYARLAERAKIFYRPVESTGCQ